MSDRVISVIIKFDGSQGEKGFKGLSGAGAGLEKQMRGIHNVMNSMIVVKLIEMAKAAFDSASAFEQQRSSLTTLMGSANQANAMLGQLQKFAAATPFTLPTLLEGTNTLKSFGIETSKIMPYLQQLGDVSLGNAEKFKSLTLAFSQVQSTGRLMGQDLLQMINQGFNPLQVISQKTGKSMADLKVDMEKGKISAQMVADAFETATSKGGMFYGALKSQSQTMSGIMSTLSDNISVTARNFGDRLLPFVKEGGIELNKFFESINSNKQVLDGMNTVVMTIVTAFETGKETFKLVGEKLFPVLTTQGEKIATAFKNLVGENTKAINGFDILAGISKVVSTGLAITGAIIGGLVRNIIDLAAAIGNSVVLLGKFGEAMLDPLNPKKWEAVGTQAQKTLDAFKNFGLGVADTVTGVIKTTQDEINTWNTDIDKSSSTLAKKYQENLDKLNKANKELAASNTAVLQDINNESEKFISIDSKLQKEWTEASSSEVQNRINKINEQRDAFIAGGINSVEVNTWAEKEITKIQNEEMQKRLESISGYVSEYSGMINSMLSSIGQIQKNASDEELFQIGQKYDAQKETIESTVTDEKEKSEKLKELEKAQEKEEREVKLRAFNAQKGFATSQAVISGISAAVESFSRGGGFPMGLIPMAASIATTGAQIAAIQSETPKFAQGGSFITTGAANFKGARVGDNSGGRELVTVTPLSSNGTNTPQQESVMRVELFGANWDELLRASQDGRLKIHQKALVR